VACSSVNQNGLCPFAFPVMMRGSIFIESSGRDILGFFVISLCKERMNFFFYHEKVRIIASTGIEPRSYS
jgi:hypothetical protein